jgi:hypothetical protein
MIYTITTPNGKVDVNIKRIECIGEIKAKCFNITFFSGAVETLRYDQIQDAYAARDGLVEAFVRDV